MPRKMQRSDPKQPENWSLIRSIIEKIIEVGEVKSIRQPIVREFQKRAREKQRLKKAGIDTKRFALLRASQKVTLMACFAGQLVLWNRGQQDTEIKIAAHCREEMALLEQGYNKVSLGVAFWGKYQNLIRWLIQKNWMQISEINSFELERPDSKTGKPKVGAEYYTEAYLKYDQTSYPEKKSATSQRNPENRQQESAEPNQSLKKIKQLEAEINQLKLKNSQLTQQNSQLVTKKRAIEQESEKLQTQIDQLTQSNQDLSAQIAQTSVEPVQPIHPTPSSLTETTPTPAPVSNDLSKVLEGLQTLAAALQQWQGQSAPGDSAIANSPSRVSPQSEPPIAAVETSPVPAAIAQARAAVNSVPAAIAQADVQRVSKASDRSPIVYNYLEQQINTIIDRLVSFNNQSPRQTEKWYISLNLFRDADLTHSLKSLRRVFTDRKVELEAHHQRHRLNHRQNTGHEAQEFKKQFADDWTNLY